MQRVEEEEVVEGRGLHYVLSTVCLPVPACSEQLAALVPKLELK